MSRNQREPRRTRVNSPSRLPSLSFSVRALIWVDMEPLLKMERARCERASEQLRSVTEKLDQFDREVSSAFSIWLHTHFGEALTHVRELHAKMEELEDQVSWVHYEAMRAGISERTAYERLARLRASGENDGGRSPTEDDADSEEFDELLRGAFEELAGPASQFDPEQYDELLGEFREQFRERLADPAQGQFQEEPSHFHRSSSPRSEHSGGDESEKRRKQLYRDLARKLHPDHNASITAESKELWHEVQDAYESKDLDRLEALAAMSEGGREHRFSQFCSVSKLRSVLVVLPS